MKRLLSFVASVVCSTFCCAVLSTSTTYGENLKSKKWQSWQQRRGTGDELDFVDASFISFVNGALSRFSAAHRPLLVHTRDTEGEDFILLLREDDSNMTHYLNITSYNNLKVISHLPVSAVAILASGLAANTSNGLYPEVLSELQQLENIVLRSISLIKSGAFSDEEQSRTQLEITSATSSFISDVLSGQIAVTPNTIADFASSVFNELSTNAQDAVLEYLSVTNATLSALIKLATITATEWEALKVVIALEPFTREEDNFLVEYYSQLLGPHSNGRVILIPDVEVVIPEKDITSASVHFSSTTDLAQAISAAFYGTGEGNIPPHDVLSRAADYVICSNRLILFACPESADHGKYSSGFVTLTLRVYAIVVVYLATLVIVVSTMLGCICSEGKRMKAERRSGGTFQVYENTHALNSHDHTSM